MDLSTLTFIDVETTGLSPVRDRIIEIGVLRMKNGRVTKTYNSLVNPDCYIPPEITMLTGITGEQLERAPTFASIAQDVSSLLEGAVFVAHNARFDYSFVRAEFARLDKSFTSTLLCTAKLSRKLFPRFRTHNLDSIIDRFGISCEIRHRAFSDAQVLAEFYKLAKKQFGTKMITEAILNVTKTASLPAAISRDRVDTLPELPGVYVFYDKNRQPLYIGKSINIKERVRSHFYDFSRSTKEARIFRTIGSVETFTTTGELGALLLESQMIKDMQPLYNRKLRKPQTMTVLFRDRTPEGYDTVRAEEGADIAPGDIENILAIFRTKGHMKRSLVELAREHTLCQKLLGLENAGGACFGSQIRTCNGACTGLELPARYNMRVTQAFSKTHVKQWPFPGPIAIREGTRAHIINKWCYVDTFGNEDTYEAANSSSDICFDYDTYRILSSFLLKKTRDYQITVLGKYNKEQIVF